MPKKMVRDAEGAVARRNRILREAKTCENGRPVRKVWELFVREGQTSKFLNRAENVTSRVFSIQNGWNFEETECQKKFMGLLKKEEPDETLMAPMCKIWSSMQELTASRSDEHRQRLVELRTENHDRVLRLVRKVYLEQYRNAREAMVTSPAAMS